MIRVLGQKVLIKRIEQPALKSSLIEIIEFAPEPSQFGLVLAVGNAPVVEVKVGDVVVLKQFSGAPVTFDMNGEEVEAFVMMNEDLLAIVGD